MVKNLLTILLVSFLMTSFIQAQNASVKIHSKQLVDDKANVTYVQENIPSPGIINGESIGVTTNYDYFSNSVIRDQIVYDEANDVVHCFNMVRPWQGAATRHAAHSYKSGGQWINQTVSNGPGGWPHIDLGLTGDLAGTVGMVWHTPCRLSIWDGSTGYITAQFDPSLDPSVQMAGSTIWLGTSGGRAVFQFYKSTDFGVSFTNWDSISAFSPSPIWWVENGGVEVGMSKSKNEQYLAYFGTNAGITGGGAHVYNGVPETQADNFWAISTTDGGATWTGKMIAPDGKFDLVSNYHTANYAPLFENFGQVDVALDNNGVTHAVANGYGLVFNATRDTAIGNSFPVLYWNSTTNTWKSISSQAIDTIQAIGDYYPTNSIGQAYPSVSVSDDGQVIYVMWTGPQLNAQGELDTADNGAGTTYYWRDLYHAFSTDGGNTWNYGGTFPGMSNTLSEVFGHAAQHLQQVNPTTYRAHIIYLADRTTGVGPFDSQLTDNDLIYTTFDITVTSADPTPVASTFELAQNYPNPFNPSTNIKYSIAERSNVTIKVYDMLGSEVATLVNQVQDAGTHNVVFNASNLASGMYVYTITAGNFTASKKMMLLK
ncbi:MAG: T9SS type A sorting domain-containing protein [Ignavibacterium sp.]|nr:T9SS type A sorting domain-containing protein [Ignavibacterium sp.]